VLGPEHLPATTLTGRVLLRGQPLSGGWLEFLPAGGTLGRLRSAEIGPEGQFRAERVPIGRVAIRLVGSPVERTGDPKIDAFTAEIRRGHALAWEIRANGPPVEIDLAVEAARTRRESSP
jgi:hypothetical protein